MEGEASDSSEVEAHLADFQIPKAPQRKREWKALSKTLQTRMDCKLDSETISGKEETLVWAGVALRHPSF